MSSKSFHKKLLPKGWRLLKDGDIIQKGDKYYNPNNGCWIETSMIGDKMGPFTINHYARPSGNVPQIVEKSKWENDEFIEVVSGEITDS